MNKIYLIGLAAFILLASSCGKSGASGELVGVGAKNFRNNEVPYGMVYVPSGAYIMGQTDQDVTFAQIAQNKQVTVPAFFMDETEITNSEYRQFVNWVRDSIAITDYLKDDKFYIKPKNANPDLNARKVIDWKKVGKGNNAIWGNKKEPVKTLQNCRVCITRATTVFLTVTRLM